MRRREFLSSLGGIAIAWPLRLDAQPSERVRRVGVLLVPAENSPEARRRMAAFEQRLQSLGWIPGRNVHIDYRFNAVDPNRTSALASELASMRMDVLLANSSPILAALQHLTRTTPIVFVQVADPVGAGFIDNLAHPGGNITGFTSFEYAMSGKWLELLREIAPKIEQVAVVRDPSFAAPAAELGAIQALAQSLRVRVKPIGVRDAAAIEREIVSFAAETGGGMIVLASPATIRHRHLIVSLANRYRLPAVYPYRYYAAGGGLIAYGPDDTDMYRQAASYVDRILKGEKPADLPVQAPTKYNLVINLKTAKALGLTIPATLLARADEVIE
jgi:ABC-type uncharacterized transport system substrate-binding protein